MFTHYDRCRLTTALRGVRDARHCRRVQAVLLVAEGHGVGGTAILLKASRRCVTKALASYRVRRCPANLAIASQVTAHHNPMVKQIEANAVEAARIKVIRGSAKLRLVTSRQLCLNVSGSGECGRHSVASVGTRALPGSGHAVIGFRMESVFMG